MPKGYIRRALKVIAVCPMQADDAETAGFAMDSLERMGDCLPEDHLFFKSLSVVSVKMNGITYKNPRPKVLVEPKEKKNA